MRELARAGEMMVADEADVATGLDPRSQGAYRARVIPHNKEIESELAIRQLAASYTDAVNRSSPEDAAQIWAPDGVLLAFGQEIPASKLLKGYRNVFSSFSVLFQMTHSGVVVVDGDRATARWWISEINQTVGDDKFRMFYGLYQDEVVRTEVGWRFARRQLDAIQTIELDATAVPQARPAPKFVDL